MSDDLVKRLREGATWDDDIAAADRIEELEAKALANKIAIMRLEAERNKFQLYLQRTHADLELEIAAVDGLNAKLAIALEALEYIKDTLSLHSAKEALAKIKGEQL